MGRTIACANQKGGVGKTTTVVNLATSLAAAGRHILVLDLDPQGNATSGFGIDRSSLSASLYDVILGDRELSSVTVPTGVDRCDLAPASVALAGAEVELASAPQRERRLARALQDAALAYDYILMDCPPSLGLLTVNALTAAESVLIPTQCEYYALEGLSQLIATLNLVRDNLNPSLAIEGVVLTMFDGRTNLSADVATEVRRHFGPAVFDTVVPRSVRLSEAPSFGLPIARYRPDSPGAVAYANLATEILRHDSEPLAQAEPGATVASQGPGHVAGSGVASTSLAGPTAATTVTGQPFAIAGQPAGARV